MFKNKIKIGIVFLFTFLTFGCEDFLKEELYGDMAGNTFPTENTAETLLNGAYARATIACVNNHNMFWATEYPTPSVMYRLRRGGSRGYFDIWSWGNSPAYGSLLDDLFYAIRSCNDAIDLIPKIEDMGDAQRQAEIVGEARFIRAMTYFYMVRLWGGMPLLDKPQTLSDDLYPSRASIAETYAFIVEDLKKAIDVLPYRSNYVSRGLLGHATKGTAMGTLAKVYITMAGAPLSDKSKLSEAKTILDQLIASKEHELLTNYSSVFDWKNENNKEILFSWASQGDEQSYNAWHYFIPQAGSYLYLPPGRWGIGYDLVEPEYALYYMQYDQGPRFQWNIAIEYTEQNGKYHHFLGGPQEAAYCVKYRCPDANSSGLPTDLPVLRYSDVLLLHSEVVNELSGPTAEAYTGINLVRQRATLDPLPAGLTKDEFREKVFIERDLELCFEQNRFFDMRRRGFQFTKNLIEHYYNPTQNGYATWSITVDEYEMLYPIPQKYLDVNPNFLQNPGY